MATFLLPNAVGCVWADRAAHMLPLGRASRLRAVGYLALYLASTASDYMTGQTIYLDGGLTR